MHLSAIVLHRVLLTLHSNLSALGWWRCLTPYAGFMGPSTDTLMSSTIDAVVTLRDSVSALLATVAFITCPSRSGIGFIFFGALLGCLDGSPSCLHDLFALLGTV